MVNGFRRLQLHSEDLLCFTSVRTLSARLSSSTCPKEGYSKLRSNPSRDFPLMVKASFPHPKGQVVRYWLCDLCAVHIAVRVGPERAAITVSTMGRLWKSNSTHNSASSIKG